MNRQTKHEKRLIFQKKTRQFLKNKNKKNLSRQTWQFFENFPWPKSSKIALYYPLMQEVNLLEWPRLYPQLQYFYPCEGGLLRKASAAPFKKTKTGFFQPASGPFYDPKDMDFFLVPGRAFDRNFVRLGRGQGFYDRLLSKASPRAVKIGICWSVQVDSDSLPCQPHDAPMEALVTEDWSLYSQKFFKKLFLTQNKR